MNDGQKTGLIAIDVGSSRIKLGWFPSAGDCSSRAEPTKLPITSMHLPEPEATLAVSHQQSKTEAIHAQITEWLTETCVTDRRTMMASVHPAAAGKIESIFPPPAGELTATDLPLEVRVKQPEKVGIDRLLNALAVNRLRLTGRSAIVIDSGTATKIDWIAEDGAFEGGAILPGITLAAAGLHMGTATLPLVFPDDLEPPPRAVGKSTHEAISSGIYWGAVCAATGLVARMSREMGSVPQVFVTGGDAPRLVESLSIQQQVPHHIPHLVLSGISLAAEALS